MLRLDDPVDRLLPELAGLRVLRRIDGPVEDTVPANRPITVRDLLTFRPGFGYFFAERMYPIHQAMFERGLGPGPPRPSRDPAPEEFMQRLASLPLLFQPGERWLYNTGSEVLSVLLARASGQTFDTLLRERLFEPLGMKDTGFCVPAEELSRFTTGYMTNPQTGAVEVYDPTDGDWSRPPAFPNGAGGLVSTVDDYLAFAQMLLNTGSHQGRRILSRASVELMTVDQLTPEQHTTSGFGPDAFADQGWGFGVAVVTRRTNFASVGSYGWSGGMGTLWESDPRKEMIAILMTQRGWESSTPAGVFVDFPTSAYAAIDD
jgi:CubicO group peptidase (beta-lactamase class C family)